MHALVITSFGGPEALSVIDLPAPEPGPGQVRVRVTAAAINPIDLSTRSGALASAGLLRPAPLIGLGWDLAGTIESVGPGVDRPAIGDRVIGLRDLLSQVPGAQAELVVLDTAAVAPAPVSISLARAATLPLNALTADGALALTGTRPGETVLVTGAAGAVGGYVLELARLRGLQTIAVAAPEDEPLVRRRGAGAFVARGEPLAAAVRSLAPGGVDAVVDAAVLGVTAHEGLRGGGTFVSLVRPFAPPPIRGTRVRVQETFADGARLAELAALVDAGLLTPPEADEIPLCDAARGHALLAAGGRRARPVLIP